MVLVLRDTQGQQNQRETHLYMEYLFWIEMQRQLNENFKKGHFSIIVLGQLDLHIFKRK